MPTPTGLPNNRWRYNVGWNNSPTPSYRGGGGVSLAARLPFEYSSLLTPEAIKTMSKVGTVAQGPSNPNWDAEYVWNYRNAPGYVTYNPNRATGSLLLHEGLHSVDQAQGFRYTINMGTLSPELRAILYARYWGGNQPTHASETHLAPGEAYATAGQFGPQAIPQALQRYYQQVFRTEPDATPDNYQPNVGTKDDTKTNKPQKAKVAGGNASKKR